MMQKWSCVSCGVVVVISFLCGLTNGNSCNQTTTLASEIKICEHGTYVVGTAYLSASNVELGDGTRCACTMVALSSSSNGSSFALNQSPRISNGSASLNVRGSSQVSYTCHTNDERSPTPMNASNITIEVLRNGSVDFWFCIAMANNPSTQDNTFNLTCGNDASIQEKTTSPATDSPMLMSTSLSTSTSGSSTPLSPTTTSSVIPVAAGVAGGLFFLLLVVIVIVVVCTRRRRKAERPLPPQRTLNVTVSHTVSQNVQLEDNILYESSSASPPGDTPKTGSATHPVKDKTGGSSTSGKASVQPGRGQYLGPAGDLYSLVQKPKENGGPEDASSAQRHSTAVDAPPADDHDNAGDPALEHD